MPTVTKIVEIIQNDKIFADQGAAARIDELMWTAENRRRMARDTIAIIRGIQDLTDAKRIEIAPLIAPDRGGGRRREVDVRNLVNGPM